MQKGKKKGGEEEEVAELGICTTPDTALSAVYSVQSCWAKKKIKKPFSNTRHSLVVKVTISLDRREKKKKKHKPRNSKALLHRRTCVSS